MNSNLDPCIHQDERRVLIHEIEYQKDLMLKLRGTVEPILPTIHDELTRSNVIQTFADMLSSSTKAISLLQVTGGGFNNKHIRFQQVGVIRNGGNYNIKSHINNLGEEDKVTANKRRKDTRHTGSLVTSSPHDDGYQWRKYGQKWISKARHSRSYYRCANSKGQGCRATKTVQQKENHASKLTSLFNVEYYGQHVCKRDDIVHPYVVEPTTTRCNMAPIDQNQCGVMMSSVSSGILFDQTQDEGLFLVHDMSDYFTDIEMARVVEAAINCPINSEPWGFGDL